MKSETLQDSGADLAQFIRRHPWLTAIVVFIAACVAVFFFLEWRSEKRWQRYAAEARARGVKLMAADFVRPEIPDEQNFAALPMIRRLFTGDEGGKLFFLPPVKSSKSDKSDYLLFPDGNAPPDRANPGQNPNIDLAIWRDYFHAVGFLTEKSDNPARDVLRALERFAPEFREWSEWHTRPQCRFLIDYTQGFNVRLPHLIPAQAATRMFVLRMRAHLAAGDSAAAYADFQDGLQVYRMLREEPSLIHGLVRIGTVGMLLDGLGDGLKNRTWAPAELERIQGDLAAIRLMDDWQFVLASERGSFNFTVESWLKATIRERGRMLSGNFGFLSPDRSTEITFQLCPRMVYRDNQLRKNRHVDELQARIDTGSQTLNLDGLTPSLGNGPTDIFERFHYFLFFISAGVYTSVETRFAWLEVVLDEARIACALERFRAKHGAYPEQLTELAPEFLPTLPSDLYARASFHYQRVGETSYRLYSVGENRTDDGGQRVPGVPDRKQLDAVWPYAPAPAAP